MTDLPHRLRYFADKFSAGYPVEVEGFCELMREAAAALEGAQPAPTPEPDGLYGKYRILKADTGKPVEGDYFVLKQTDRHSWMALRAYATSVLDENEELANDIRLLVGRHEREAHERSYMQGKGAQS